MIDPTPPMTACELHELFSRYIEDEQMAQARVASADFVEREAIDRHDADSTRPLLRAIEAVGLQPFLDELWARLYGTKGKS